VAGTQALGLDASVSAPLGHITRACQALAPTRGSMAKPLRVLIAGVPNVGKSTLINTLTVRRAAKTGDEAGVTRLTQRIVLADGFYLFDTPGVLWPRIAVPQSGYNLAASGAIGKNAYEDVDVALALLGYLKTRYAALVEARYALVGVAVLPDESLLEAIGRKRAALQSGGRVNLQKAAELVIHDLRSGALGRVTLEAPTEFSGWQAAAAVADAARQAQKDGRKQKR
jgi:ribosome biogenesis GTPase A